MKFQPWKAVEILNITAVHLKQELPLPNYISRISTGVSRYEKKLRELWAEFKKNPTEQNAQKLAEFMKEHSDQIWLGTTLDILGLEELSPQQRLILEQKLQEHHNYIDNSLLPDIITAIQAGQLDFSNMDYRIIFLYAGALWSFGFLATIMFDGLELRDLADLFMFVGPDDESTCAGERGCKQHINKVYTVAQILADNIIPGNFKCLTSCRHMLVPVASPL